MPAKARSISRATTATAPAAAGIEAFSFGDPTPVLEHADILDCFECWKNGHWYESPVNLAGLVKSFNAGVHHSSAIHFKANVLASTLIPSKYLPRASLRATSWCRCRRSSKRSTSGPAWKW